MDPRMGAGTGAGNQDVIMDDRHTTRNSNSASVPRRRPPPSSIPNFPRNRARDPPAQIASPSPTASPPPSSPFASPSRPSPGPTSMLHPMPLPPAVTKMQGDDGVTSPWLALAATSGAPTPSLEGPGKASPHLGYPFERLNIGGSWSGANLLDGTRRRKSLTGENDPPPQDPNDVFAKYRALAGHASANAKGKTRSMEVDPAPEPMRLNFPQPKVPSPLGTSKSRAIKPLTTQSFPPLVSLPTTLVLDLRPPSSFHSSHIPKSHSLPIPSTLLRRPAFNLDKLTEMLSSPAREAVASWREKRDIVMLDADSTRIPENSVMTGLASKFEREGFQGTMWFLQGGHAALSATDVDMVSEEGDTVAPPGARGFMAGKLGSLAFQQGSTGSNLQRRKDGVPTTPATPYRSDPFSPASSHTERANPALTSPGFSGVSGSSSRSGSGSGSGPNSESGPHQSYNIQPANPFFDNIRQNLELSHEGISERIQLELPFAITSRAAEFPDWLRQLILLPPEEAAERLAGEFYQVELKEQHRLQAVMDWHSRDSGKTLPRDAENSLRDDLDTVWPYDERRPSMSDYFPFSISAGVERGAKNRYKNIWPYDFSRVKLDSPPDKDCDYINASYVQPRGTSRKYIATQGPLDATYRDFWTLIWEQGVRVIVMLTKQFEGGLLKCGNYWEDSTYGSLRVSLDSQIGGDDQRVAEEPGFNFGSAFNDKTAQAADEEQDNIHRTFTLQNQSGESRKVVQIQCTAWPDFDVPDSPEVLLNLLRDVNVAVDGICEDCEGRSTQPPVLVHCSAGVGRTGSFIIVDAIVDSLRRDRDAVSAQAIQTPISCGATDSSSPSPSSIARPTDSIPASTAPTSRQESRSRSPSLSRSGTRAGKQDDKNKMDLDSPTFGKVSLPDPTPPETRPSLSTGHTSGSSRRSSERTEVERRSSYNDDKARALRRDFGIVPILTKSTDRHRTPSPICPPDGSSPVASVLEGMRVQRMSLVQSLRQYIFVHRAIIYSYINMVDSDRHREASQSSASVSTESTNPLYSATSTRESTSVTSMSTLDDRSISSVRSGKSGTVAEDDFEISAKRRASPTELTPDKISPVVELPLSGSVADMSGGLSKRLSSKKMRSESGAGAGTSLIGGVLGGLGGSIPESNSSSQSRVPSVSPEKSKRRTQEISSDSTGSSSSTVRPE